jgi:septal ring factor EnvC (AmiA/AmiB activator)
MVVTLATASSTEAQANPIRRVVSLLQQMQAKIEEEGKRQTKAMAKYRCYCKTNDEELKKSISDAKANVELLESKIQAATNGKAQSEADLAQAKQDRTEANEAIESAQASRDKEAKDFAEESGEMKANIEAMGKAIPAIENGMSGAFLQTVGRLVSNSPNLAPEEREQVQEFLQSRSSSDAGYAPASGQIVGILKQMKETMEADLVELTKQENEAIESFNGMQAAKNKEIQASTESIEENSSKIGELGVSIVTMQGNMKDTVDTIGADEGFLEELGKSCVDMEKDFELIVASRSEELAAVADTIKVLNDDDALELFKKTVPSTSLLQVQQSNAGLRSKVLAAIQSARASLTSPQLDLISLAVRSKTASFEKVLKMIDNLSEVLHKEQADDDTKKDYCNAELHKTDQEKKELQHKLMTLSNEMQDHKDNLERLRTQVSELEQGIKDLDKAVADATEQRKEEHDEYVQEAAENQGALQVLEFAKNRLNKFYNPKEYKEPPKRELTEEERMYSAYGGDIGTTPAPGGIANTGAMAFVQVSAHSHDEDRPAPPPKVGGFKKNEASKGVLGMIDMIVQDLKTEVQEAEFEEKQAQEDYEKLMADSAEKRAADAKSISAREGAIAEREQDLQEAKDTSMAKMKELQENQEYTADVHKTCDFLVENYEKRKEARAMEMDGLAKAKAILSGADFSFVQTSAFLQPRE